MRSPASKAGSRSWPPRAFGAGAIEKLRSAVAADAVGSRLPERRRLGLERMRAHGVDIVDSEMVVFEWLGGAGTPEFKELSRLIR